MLVVLAGLLGVSLKATAADRIPPGSRYVFQPIGYDQGYDTITPYSVIQDTEGFLWIASQSGLFRYDGSELHLFGEEEYGLNETDTQQVLQAPNGTIWAAQSADVYYYDGKRFHQLDVGEKDVLAGGKLAFTHRMACDKKSNLYLAHDKGVLRFEADNLSRRRLWTTKDGLPSGSVGAVEAARDGSILFTVMDALGKIDPGTGKVTMLGSLDVVPREHIYSIATTSDNRISLRTQSHLMWYDASDGTFTADDEGLTPDPNEAGHYIDSKDNIWVCTSLGVYFKQNGKWVGLSIANGLPSNSMRTVTEDHEGAIWLGLSGYGMHRWPGSTKWRAWTTEEGLGSDHVWCMIRDKYDRLILGNNQGIDIFDPATGKWTSYTSADGLVGSAVRRLREDGEGRIWALSRRAGFNVIDPETLEIQAIPVPEKYSAGPIDMNVGPDGKMWVTGDGHLYRAYIEDDQPVFKDVVLPKGRIGCEFVVAIADNGVAWTGGSIGLCRYDGETWQHFTAEKNGMQQDAVEDIIPLSDNTVWLNYRDNSQGVSKLTVNPDGTTTIHHVRVEDGITEGPVYMMERGGDDVWIGGAFGVSVVEPDYSVWTANHHDGLIWDDIDRGGLYTEPDGRIWVGTSGGLALYTPGGEKVETHSPNVKLVSASLGGEEKRYEESPRVDFEHNTLVARFSGLTFRNTHKVGFKYRLVGLEEEFTETNLREVRYAKLDPGEYMFQVYCRSSKGIWSDTPAVFAFEVLAPWWRSWWVYTLSGLLIVLIVAGVYLASVKRMRTRDREVSMLAWEKTKGALSSQISALKNMIDETSAITNDMGTLSQKMESISSGLEASVSGASAAIEELGRTGSQSEQNAKTIVDAASTSTQFARKGQEAVAESKFIMEDVERDASQIVDKSTRMFNRLEEVDIILTMVNSIADQSRVLAINASIEAATAGEYGAGFGVVAKEVGSLAEQIKELTLKVSEVLTSSHGSIKEIVKSAGKAQSRMEDGVRSVSNSGDIVNELSEALDKNTELARIIKTAIGEQHMGLSLISTEIQKVYTTSSDSTAISGRVAEQAKQLEKVVEQLDEMIENWKTPDLLL